MSKMLVLHGVNLNLFGRRDAAHYGTITLETINNQLQAVGAEHGVEVECFQTNDEGAFVERIHACLDDGVDGVLINAGAWTHYSYAFADALAVLTVPIVEVHMSHVRAREEFRRTSVLSPVVKGSVEGFGVDSYLLGLRALIRLVHGKID